VTCLVSACTADRMKHSRHVGARTCGCCHGVAVKGTAAVEVQPQEGPHQTGARGIEALPCMNVDHCKCHQHD